MFTNDQAIVKLIPRFCVNQLCEKSCRVADVYDESTFNVFFIKGVNPFSFHCFRKYWTTHLQADGTDIAFKAQSLLIVQK